ncbi:maleylpyruvate isomerase family mycothiol-dependent enzyme [Nocardioides speluncae]|uniref:maleylpyruvate isomerase family mycothiol-dependent enzyme n=1 Tax=Nocardioides speluncae TaxID=2670337 RepID=UPI00137A7957|nr:maleylpyruvate isomerase family mycothiol-dependent enzyme [Nocardioides speluncae]
MTGNVPAPQLSEPDLTAVHDATTRYLQTVDASTDSLLREPSVLPGWSRGHVVAHVALNALGFARALDGITHDKPAPIYDSQERRDADIEEYAGFPADRLREVSFDACGRLKAAFEREYAADATIHRTPGGPEWPVSELISTRCREVEIHHADLLLDYGPGDWPEQFAEYLLELAAYDRGDEHNLQLRTPAAKVAVGDGSGPEITGSVADLAWWLLGRGTGDGLSGELPELGPWHRRR